MSGSPTMHAFAFICLAAAAPHAWGLLDARARRRGREAGKNRRLSDELFPELVKLVASDAAAVDYFGSSVAIDGDTVVIGATGAGTGGAVYVLRASDGEELAKLTASDAAIADLFGYSVAIDGNTIVVGAHERRRRRHQLGLGPSSKRAPGAHTTRWPS